ncbi:MAG: hypothetical protein ACJ71G_18995 [Nitrososphaeraceae archaeon]
MCGKFGFVRKMWIPSTYYPKHCSIKCIRLEEEKRKLSEDPSSELQKQYVNYFRKMIRGYVRGNKDEYRGRSEKHLFGHEDSEAANIIDKKSLIRVTYGTYPYFYIGHYDKEKYKEQMARYRKGEIKYRPNGRKWCKIPLSIHKFYTANNPNGKYIRFIIGDHT